MRFDEKLKGAMQQLNIKQSQVSGMTGIGKSSISQYVSGKNVPTAERQKHIAVSLGLAPDYFEQDDVPILKLLQQKDGVITRLDIARAAELMQMNHNTIRKGLQQGVFPWGYAIHTSEHRWAYFINARRFAEIEGIDLGKAV